MQHTRNPVIWRHVRATRRNRHSDLNIRPIMNLFMLLVPALLVSATFIEISVLHTALTDEGGRSSSGLRPGLILEIDDGGFTLISRTCDLRRAVDKQERAAGNGKLRFPGYDMSGLNGTLRAVKALFPEEREITLVPTRASDYQLVVSTMDAVREYRDAGGVKPLFTNIAFLKPHAASATGAKP